MTINTAEIILAQRMQERDDAFSAWTHSTDAQASAAFEKYSYAQVAMIRAADQYRRAYCQVRQQEERDKSDVERERQYLSDIRRMPRSDSA